jgi:D-alanyl-D-alanine carboxypeptidase/D-alanyl-D-alanine-endopeptidase (penicillin-binding protein 4)
MIWGTPEVIVRGEFPISERPFSIEVAAPDPLRRAGEALRAALAEQGIEVMGALKVTDRPAALAGLDELASWSSPPLSEWLPEILSDSDNWYAEMLLRGIALRVEGEGRLDLGVDVLTRFLTEVVGVAEGSFEIDDGSGLSPSNLISPRAVVELLRWSLKQEWLPTFVANLANGEQGTLSRTWRSAPPLAAKTGTLRHSQTLAGYLDPASPEPTVFAIFLNHRTESRAQLKKEIVDQLGRWRTQP